jgi:hypothetical protein
MGAPNCSFFRSSNAVAGRQFRFSLFRLLRSWRDTHSQIEVEQQLATETAPSGAVPISGSSDDHALRQPGLPSTAIIRRIAKRENTIAAVLALIKEWQGRP